MSRLVLYNIGELVTNAADAPDVIGRHAPGALAVEGRAVVWAGPERDLPWDLAGAETLDCEGRAVVPGFVDAHTHLVFAGDRSGEFGARLGGRSYEDALAGGGGIHHTVEATRAATLEQLRHSAAGRARRMLEHGTTTIEIKSGYGLDTAAEIRSLQAARGVANDVPVNVVTTFLGAHVVPLEFAADREAYVRLVESEMLPAVADLADFCDVFCDRGAFDLVEAYRILTAAKTYGLRPRIHANELGSTGGVQVAIDAGAVSADHLIHLNADEIADLAQAGVVATLLPGTSFSLREPYAPGAALFEAGVTVALGTDCNPGTSYTESMQFVIALAVVQMGLTPEQAVWAATRGGALSLQRPELGWLGPGAAADFVVLDAPSFLHIPYRPATNLVWKVFSSGVQVVG